MNRDICIRRIDDSEKVEALSLVWSVFKEYEAPDYSKEGIEEFYKSIHDKSYLSQLCTYGAFISHKLVGVIATRSEGTHVALFFVEGKYHRQGIGKQLFKTVLKECRADKMTVNSSPYAVPIYHKLGFYDVDSEQVVKGVRFTPMEFEMQGNLVINEERDIVMGNRKVVLYIGISLDGYIATKDDSLEWLLNTQGSGDNGFGEFYDTVETIIMGRRTYDWIMEQENGQFPYIGKECYVYSTRMTDDTEYVKFTTQSPENLIAGLKKEGKKIWIVGGSQVIDLVRKKNLIDEYILNIAPVVLGEGISLFCEGERENLIFDRVRTFGQFVEISYHTEK